MSHTKLPKDNLVNEIFEPYSKMNTIIIHFVHLSGGLHSRAGHLRRENSCPGPTCVPQWCLLRLRDWGDLPGGWESVHSHHGQPGHPADLHAPGVWCHCAVNHPHTHAVGAVAAWFHPPAHKDQTQRCPRHSAQHRSPESGQLWPQPKVSHIKMMLVYWKGAVNPYLFLYLFL